MASLQWYDLRAEGHGTITIKARSQAEAIEEAAERWHCSEDEVVCVGWSPYFRKNYA